MYNIRTNYLYSFPRRTCSMKQIIHNVFNHCFFATYHLHNKTTHNCSVSNVAHHCIFNTVHATLLICKIDLEKINQSNSLRTALRLAGNWDYGAIQFLVLLSTLYGTKMYRNASHCKLVLCLVQNE